MLSKWDGFYYRTERKREHVKLKTQRNTNRVKQKLCAVVFSTNLPDVCYVRAAVIEDLGCGDEGHVFGDQQTVEDTTYFIQLWTQLLFGSVGIHWAVLPQFLCVLFPYLALSDDASL